MSIYIAYRRRKTSRTALASTGIGCIIFIVYQMVT